MKLQEAPAVIETIALELGVTHVYAPIRARLDDLFPQPLWESVSETAAVNWYERRVAFLGAHCASWREFLFRVHELVHAAWPEHPSLTHEGLAFIGVEYRLIRYLGLTDRWIRAGFADDLERLGEKQELPESARIVRRLWRRYHRAGDRLTAKTIRWALLRAEEAALREGYLSRVGGFSKLHARRALYLSDVLRGYERLAGDLETSRRFMTEKKGP